MAERVSDRRSWRSTRTRTRRRARVSDSAIRTRRCGWGQDATQAMKAAERKPLTGEVEEAANECEKKIFDVLNAEGIGHVATERL